MLLEELCERFAEQTGVRGECMTMQRAVCRPVQRQKHLPPEQDSQRVKDLRFAIDCVSR